MSMRDDFLSAEPPSLVIGTLHSADFEQNTVTIKGDGLPRLKAGQYAVLPVGELHAMILEIATFRKAMVNLRTRHNQSHAGEAQANA